MENLKYTFDQVNDWIKTADQKALILGSFNVAGFIFQLLNFDKLKCWSILTIILFISSIIVTLIATFFWLRIIYPKLDNKSKGSRIYFQHIANAYVKNKKDGIEELINFDEGKFKEDLANQIIINSMIAKNKYHDIQKFIWLFGLQLFIFVLVFISQL